LLLLSQVYRKNKPEAVIDTLNFTGREVLLKK